MNLNTTYIPELAFLESWIAQNPLSYTQIRDLYQGLIDGILSISAQEIDIIARSRAEMLQQNIRLHSASALNTAVFLKSIQSQREEIREILKQAFDMRSQSSQAALTNLQSMLEAGSRIAQNATEKPKDGDPIWDTVIWGHTQANPDVAPEVLIHFILSHYLCQYMNLTLGADFGLTQKDDFINILADLILLEQAKSSGDESVYQIWLTSKADGGLGWVDEGQLGVYRESLWK